MIKEQEYQYQYSQPPRWPECDLKIKYDYPKRLVNNIHQLEKTDSVACVKSEKNITLQIGIGPLRDSIGFTDSVILSDLSDFAEKTTPKVWEKVTAHITGSAAYELIASYFLWGKDQEIYHWFLESTGVVLNDPNSDIDIYLNKASYEYISEKYPHKKIKGRTVKDLNIIEIEEQTEKKKYKFQFHNIEGSNLSPIAQCAFLAPTNLHMVGVAMIGPMFEIVDPLGALRKGPYKQVPPMHLIDSNNPLGNNTARVINGMLIYGLSTPKLPDKYKPEYLKIKNYISEHSPKLTNDQEKVVIERYKKWSMKIPWETYDGYFGMVAKRLGKLGLNTYLLDLATKYNDRNLEFSILYQTLLYAQQIKMPEALKLDDQDVGLNFDKYKSQMINIFNQIDWGNI